MPAFLKPYTLYKPEAVDKFFQAARLRRVDWIGLSDSNEVQGGFGRNHGIQYALATRYQLYGTGSISGNENLGPGSNMGYFVNAANNGGRVNDNATCPAGLNAYNPYTVAGISGSQFATNYYWFMNDAQSDGNNTGMVVTPGGPHNVNSSWNARYRYGLPSTAGAGNFRPAIRRGDSPFTQLAIASEVITGGGGDTLVTLDLALGAATRDYNLDFRWGPSAYTINGPVFLLWQKADDTAKTWGWQYHTAVYRGGQGLVEFAQAVAVSATGLQEHLRWCCDSQTGAPMALVSICSGLNDRNDAAEPSVGPIGGLASDTPAGYADNMRAIINSYRTAWLALGYDIRNLGFLLWPSHPISLIDDPKLNSYRAVVSQVADSYDNTACLFTEPIFNSYLQRNATTWYASGGADTLHMTQTGYEQTLLLSLDEIIRVTGA